MIMQTSAFISEEAALSWASQHFSFTNHRTIRDYPWSTIFELNGSAETGFLKLVPLRQLQVLKNHSVLSRHFQSIIPGTIAINEELGVQLFRHHGGIELASATSAIQRKKLLTTYAEMQTDARENPEILSSLPRFHLNDIVTNFLEFLKPDKENAIRSDAPVKAEFFLGSEESREYYDVFLARKDLLDDFLKDAALLPPTLNHCDLRPENAAESNDGSSIIYDWDDALIGPAGLSLHAFFGSCFRITQFLDADFSGIQDEDFHTEKQLFNDYIAELNNQGYAASEILQKALPASACAGAMQALLTYANFPIQDDLYIFDIDEYFVKRLDDLLNLCDYLSCSTRSNTLHFANDYQERNILFRSGYIYQRYLNAHPNDFEIHKMLASILNRTGKWEEAIDCFNTIIDDNPGDAETFNELGVTLLKNQNPTDAIVKFELALSIDPDYKAAQINRDKTAELLTMIDEAGHPNKLPPVRVSPEERDSGQFSSEKTDLASSLFRQHGALVVENVFDVDMLQAIKKLILDRYDSYFEPREYDDCLRLGDKRHMVTLDIEGPINSPDLYDNPFISAITKKILGKDFILGAINIGVSLPDSRNQSIHKDYPPLFDEDDEFRDNIPCFALAVLIPLVQHSHTVGTTLVIKDSHKIDHIEAQKLPGQAPLLEIGSCLMIDYRVGHQGLANSSEDVVRPLLTLIFHRPWFRDCVNYRKQLPVKIDDAAFNSAPERLKELVSWAKSEAIINPIKPGEG